MGYIGPDSVSISSIIGITRLLESLAFDLSLQYNRQKRGSSGYATLGLSSDALDNGFYAVGVQQDPPDKEERSERGGVYCRQQQLLVPGVIQVGPGIWGAGDSSLDNTLHNTDPIGEIPAVAESRPSQDVVNTLDKAGHLRHPDRNLG